MQKVLSTLLIALILLSSTKATYSMHLCGGEIVESSLAFGEHNLDCGMSNGNDLCMDKSNQPISFSKKCCDNVYHSVDTDENYQLSNTTICYNHNYSLPSNPDLKLTQFVSLNKLGVNGLSPPVISVLTNFQVAFQTFLI